MLFYAAAAAMLFVLALGPGGSPDGPPSFLRPYSWLLWLPGYDGLRVPARFVMPGIACLSIAAGIAIALVPRRGGLRILVATAALAGIAIDGAMERVPMTAPPPRINLAGAEDAAVLEIPPDDPRVSAAAMYRSIWHRQPLVNGYSGHMPPHYTVLSLALWRGDTSVLSYLARERPLVIAVNTAADPGGGFERMVAGVPGIARLGASSVGPLFLLPRVGVPGARRHEPVAAQSRADGPRRLVFDTGSVRMLSGIGFPLRGRYQDLAERLRIEASEDGTRWQEVWLGWTGEFALAGVLRDPRIAPVEIPFAATRARYLRVYPASGWMAAEASVLH